MEDIYSHQKIHYHLDKLLEMKQGLQPVPVKVQLIPTNACNHNCVFCAYRSANGFNKFGFDATKSIKENKIIEILDDCHTMGVKAIEVTGGGEPLLYPHKLTLFKKIQERNLEYSLITNGVYLTKDVSEVILENMSWCRVSIDAGTKNTYKIVRNTNEDEFNTVINNLYNVKKYAKNPEFRLGAGFVICNENYMDIYEFVKIISDIGVDLVRIGLIFHDEKEAYYKPDVLQKSMELLDKVKQDFKTIRIYDTVKERYKNIIHKTQNYKFCGMQHLGTMIGADSKVYTCCILCYHAKGYIGDISNSRFIDVWNSAEKIHKFNNFNSEKICNYMCLYEEKNKYINELLKEKPVHKNFL